MRRNVLAVGFLGLGLVLLVSFGCEDANDQQGHRFTSSSELPRGFCVNLASIKPYSMIYILGSSKGSGEIKNS